MEGGIDEAENTEERQKKWQDIDEKNAGGNVQENNKNKQEQTQRRGNVTGKKTADQTLQWMVARSARDEAEWTWGGG